MSTLLVASPLTARSGVYRSTIDLVRTARARGLDWHGVIGVRPGAPGAPTDAEAITEYVVDERGRDLLDAIRRAVESDCTSADTVITMIPQSDIALAGRIPGRHVAWVRGLPWPARGEQHAARRLALRTLETRALRRADDVWAVSPLLAEQVAAARRASVVPGGVPLLRRTSHGDAATPLVWAGRMSPEKGPREMLGIARRTGIPTRMYGDGPLLHDLQCNTSVEVDWAGWGDPAAIWSSGGIALCTSHRDAFGRSPVEAASAGMPVVLSDQTGVAPLLYTAPDLVERFVLRVDDTTGWDRAVTDLTVNTALRRRVSDHVWQNAQSLSIEASLEAALGYLN